MIMARIFEVMTTIHMVACIPQNDLLTKPITPAFDLLVGGIGGFLAKIGVVAVLVIIAAFAIFKIIRQRDAKEELGKLVWVAAVLPALIIVLILFTTIFNAMNNLCA